MTQLKDRSVRTRRLAGYASALLASACWSSVAVALATDAETGEVADDEGEEILVTGYRASLESSADAKREAIGFTVTVKNTGAGTATGVTVSDPLPGGNGVAWSIDPATTG